MRLCLCGVLLKCTSPHAEASVSAGRVKVAHASAAEVAGWVWGASCDDCSTGQPLPPWQLCRARATLFPGTTSLRCYHALADLSLELDKPDACHCSPKEGPSCQLDTARHLQLQTAMVDPELPSEHHPRSFTRGRRVSHRTWPVCSPPNCPATRPQPELSEPIAFPLVVARARVSFGDCKGDSPRGI